MPNLKMLPLEDSTLDTEMLPGNHFCSPLLIRVILRVRYVKYISVYFCLTYKLTYTFNYLLERPLLIYQKHVQGEHCIK